MERQTERKLRINTTSPVYQPRDEAKDKDDLQAHHIHDCISLDEGMKLVMEEKTTLTGSTREQHAQKRRYEDVTVDSVLEDGEVNDTLMVQRNMSHKKQKLKIM